MTGIGSQHTDQLSLTRTSSEDYCEKLKANTETFPADNAYSKANKSCENNAAKAIADGFPELSKDEKSTIPLKLGYFFVKI